MKDFSEELLTAYVLGELDDEERARVEAAIRDDADLAAEMRRLRQTASYLGKELQPEPDLRLSSGRRARIYVELGKAQGESERSGWFRPLVWGPIAATALVLVVVSQTGLPTAPVNREAFDLLEAKPQAASAPKIRVEQEVAVLDEALPPSTPAAEPEPEAAPRSSGAPNRQPAKSGAPFKSEDRLERFAAGSPPPTALEEQVAAPETKAAPRERSAARQVLSAEKPMVAKKRAPAPVVSNEAGLDLEADIALQAPSEPAAAPAPTPTHSVETLTDGVRVRMTVPGDLAEGDWAERLSRMAAAALPKTSTPSVEADKSSPTAAGASAPTADPAPAAPAPAEEEAGGLTIFHSEVRVRVNAELEGRIEKVEDGCRVTVRSGDRTQSRTVSTCSPDALEALVKSLVEQLPEAGR